LGSKIHLKNSSQKIISKNHLKKWVQKIISKIHPKNHLKNAPKKCKISPLNPRASQPIHPWTHSTTQFDSVHHRV
jgi:hypothetical protein